MSEAIERAKQEVFRLCREGRWRMSIPVNLERDSDCLIIDGLKAGEAHAHTARLLRDMLHRAAEAEDPDQWITEGVKLLGSPEILALGPIVTLLGQPITEEERRRISADGP